MKNFPKEYLEAIEEGLITCRKHPVYNLWILNYTPEAMYNRYWNSITRKCRGLVLDEKGNTIALPFDKFFNLEECEGLGIKVPYDEKFIAYEKLDGSLGIAFFYDNKWIMATRGSFESEQAKKGQILLDKLLETQQLPPGLTYLFEIICEESKVVVRYEKEKLVFLGARNPSWGHQEYNFFGPYSPLFDNLVVDRPKVFPCDKIENLPKDLDNFEGYIIEFTNKLRVKVKLKEYLRLHKIVCGLSKRVLWEHLKEGGNLESFVSILPDEFQNEYSETGEDLIAEHNSLLALHLIWVKSLFDSEPGLTRKEHADRIVEATKERECVGGMLIKLNSSVLFMLLDGKNEKASKKVWDLVKV